MAMNQARLKGALLAGLFATAGLGLLGAPRPAAAQPPPKAAPVRKTILLDRIVAVVNNSIILQSDLQTRLALASGEEAVSEDTRRSEAMRARVLDDMVNEELILQAADRAEVDVDPAEIDAHIAGIKEQYELDDAGLEEEVLKQGQSMAAFRNDIRKQLRRYRAINQQVTPKIDITDEDVRARYDQMARRADSVAAVFVAHILVGVPENATVSQREAAKAKAVAIKKRLDAGELFKAVAAEVSDDAATKASGGELGWFERGSLAWDSVVFAMKVGETSQPVAGPQGFHILRVNDKKTSAAGDFDKVKVSIKNDMWRREVEKKTSEWIEELRRDAYIDLK